MCSAGLYGADGHRADLGHVRQPAVREHDEQQATAMMHMTATFVLTTGTVPV